MIKKRRKRSPQVTCLCARYKFPHRLGGGKCTGAGWAESYFTHEREECEYCNNNNDLTGECDVASGLETIKYCEGAKMHLWTQSDRRHPHDFETDEEAYRRLEARYGPEDRDRSYDDDVPF